MFTFFGIDFLAVFVATLVANVIGAVWFGPKTFFPIWWKILGKSPDEQPGSSNMAYIFGMTFLGGLIGLVIGGGTSLSHRMFAGQGFKIWALEVGNDVVALAGAGAILTLF